jgi:hypothetical protein
MCKGPYPTIEQQARVLRAEPDMPRWTFGQYITAVETINSMLFATYVRFIARPRESKS